MACAVLLPAWPAVAGRNPQSRQDPAPAESQLLCNAHGSTGIHAMPTGAQTEHGHPCNACGSRGTCAMPMGAVAPLQCPREHWHPCSAHGEHAWSTGSHGAPTGGIHGSRATPEHTRGAPAPTESPRKRAWIVAPHERHGARAALPPPPAVARFRRGRHRPPPALPHWPCALPLRRRR